MVFKVSPPISVRPAVLPAPPASKPKIDPAETASTWISKFNSLLPSADAALKDLFTQGAYWKDHLCLSWNLHTFHTPSKIYEFLTNHPQGVRIRKVSQDAAHPAAEHAVDFYGKVPSVVIWLSVETDVGKGRGLVQLVFDNGEWKAFTVFTTLKELRGFEEPTDARRPLVARTDGKQWKKGREDDLEFRDSDPTVMIIGGGQAGLMTAARLKMLGVSSVMIERLPRVGDSWRNRYDSLVLHDPVFYDHLPYMNFPSTWPVYIPKDKLADWIEMYAIALELNVWTSTTIQSTSYDEAASIWTVELQRAGKPRTIKPRHVVLAAGPLGLPNIPSFSGMSDFSGRLCHSSKFPGATPAKESGKKAVVIGSCTSGHDIAQDYHNNGWDVTLVQRSSTLVVTGSSALEFLGFRGIFDGTGPPLDDADLLWNSLPYAVMKAIGIESTKACNAKDKELLDGLKSRGMKLDDGPDGAGLFPKVIEKTGGYYIDAGCSALIASGAIEIKAGQAAKITNKSVVFEDGSELPADEIVLATGYLPMRNSATEIFGEETLEGVADVWGLDEEGELRGVWRKSGKKGFWVVAGNLAMDRYFSPLLAMQIKGIEEGITGWQDL